MDKEIKNILDFSVVHVGTIPNSSHMEKQGLTDSLESIEKNGLVVKALNQSFLVVLCQLRRKPHPSERKMGQCFISHCKQTCSGGCYYLPIVSAHEANET